MGFRGASAPIQAFNGMKTSFGRAGQRRNLAQAYPTLGSHEGGVVQTTLSVCRLCWRHAQVPCGAALVSRGQLYRSQAANQE
jgi:hypothetical protein